MTYEKILSKVRLIENAKDMLAEIFNTAHQLSLLDEERIYDKSY